MEYVNYQTANRVATITLNRPDKRNALNAQVVTELKQAFTQAAEDAQAKVVVPPVVVASEASSSCPLESRSPPNSPMGAEKHKVAHGTSWKEKC